MKKFKLLTVLAISLFILSGCTKASKSSFPIPGSTKNQSEQNGTTNFQTSKSLEEVLSFYHTELKAMGLTERTLNTAVTETTFSIVYDGHENGKAIVVQGVKLDEKSTNVNIRFEDI